MQKFRQTDIRDHLLLRARVIQLIRDFFIQNGYLEVETPIRIPAVAPEPFIDPVPSGSWFLQTSPELCMKRLLAAGFEKIFQICKCFRKGERGKQHLEEFTLLEWYAAGSTYLDLMQHCEDLFTYLGKHLGLGDILHYQGKRIELTPPWPRLKVADAFSRFAKTGIEAALKQNTFDEAVAFDIEPRLGNTKPVFLTDFPRSRCTLAKPHPKDPDTGQRFELFVAGLELCNGFTELTDPVTQKKNFRTEIDRRRRSGLPVPPLPGAFLDALAHMPDAAGNALGIDRLIMLLSGSPVIDNMVAFTPEEL